MNNSGWKEVRAAALAMYPDGAARRISLGTTAQTVPENLPDGGYSGSLDRTSLLVVNADSLRKISCGTSQDDGGVPDCTVPGFGLTLFANGGTATFQTARPVVCVACTAGGASVEYQEETCRD